ncbi:putative small secreted protein [Paucimonas lemoignei]|uniref:Putative small secreted protein n=1 Tax=Paucimonas lemoignei TaxID=29443 RepID=A0A4R3I2X8_PAULE|nr:entericidin A/B family lipoprotein [Paucimonas lemoignei]TCS39624.1 putative small secreted protein [Paucimonas lemoignei]
MKNVFLLILSVMLLNACHTVEGFGKDVQKVGSKMEEAARR